MISVFSSFPCALRFFTVQNYCCILPQTERVCKFIDFFSNMQVFLLNSSGIVHFETKNRVRDWKGYGIWYKCGTCEPLQSQTSSKRTCKADRARSLNLQWFLLSPQIVNLRGPQGDGGKLWLEGTPK